MGNSDRIIVAIGIETEIFKSNRILDPDWADRFPGSQWIPILCKKLMIKGITVVTADVALSHVVNGYWSIADINVIQHQNDEDCKRLVNMGARPLLLLALESPLYSKEFLQVGKEIGEKFPCRIMLSAFYDYFRFGKGINHILRFPAFYADKIHTSLPWNERSFMVVVNKNIYPDIFSKYYLRHPSDVVRVLLRSFKTYVLNFRKIRRLPKFEYVPLHDRRLSAICYFGQNRKLKLYGYEWDKLENLPVFYQKKLQTILPFLQPEPCSSKIDTIRKFKFCLCFENASYKGGISEKIIDCFVAGVIPLYLGASDIEQFFPANTFIDVRSFSTWESLHVQLQSISESDAAQMIANGRAFLTTEDGKLHSFDGFASFIENIISDRLSEPNTDQTK